MKIKLAIAILVTLVVAGASVVTAQTGNISGMKFNDSNANGVRDSGELGLCGWTIMLIMPDGSNVTAITDLSGNYTFSKLSAGNYTVSEVLLTGWTQTAPVGGTYSVNLLDGGNVTGKDFGNTMVPPTTPTATATVTETANVTATATETVAGTPVETVTGTVIATTTGTPPPPTAVPEFPTLVLPVAEIMALAMLLLYQRRKDK